MSDPYETLAPGTTSPGIGAFAITPGASALSIIPRALYVGTGGNVVVTIGGSSVTFSNVPGGTILPIRPTHVTGTTTASNIVGIY